jgi:hypothetical protein
VIVGAGFGGLFAAKGLRSAPAAVTLINATTYHLFEPLHHAAALDGELPRPGPVGADRHGTADRGPQRTAPPGRRVAEPGMRRYGSEARCQGATWIVAPATRSNGAGPRSSGTFLRPSWPGSVTYSSCGVAASAAAP